MTIAIVDTGVDYGHSQLAPNVLAGQGYDFYNNDADPMDDNGHGTHVAGIAAATVGTSADSMAGVCPFCKSAARQGAGRQRQRQPRRGSQRHHVCSGSRRQGHQPQPGRNRRNCDAAECRRLCLEPRERWSWQPPATTVRTPSYIPRHTPMPWRLPQPTRTITTLASRAMATPRRRTWPSRRPARPSTRPIPRANGRTPTPCTRALRWPRLTYQAWPDCSLRKMAAARTPWSAISSRRPRKTSVPWAAIPSLGPAGSTRTGPS